MFCSQVLQESRIPVTTRGQNHLDLILWLISISLIIVPTILRWFKTGEFELETRKTNLYISKSWNVVFIVATLQLSHISVLVTIIFLFNFPIFFFNIYSFFFKIFTLSLTFLYLLLFHFSTIPYININFHLPTTLFLTFSSLHYPLP